MISLTKCILLLSVANAQSFTGPIPPNHSLAIKQPLTQLGPPANIDNSLLLADSPQAFAKAQEASSLPDEAFLVCGAAEQDTSGEQQEENPDFTDDSQEVVTTKASERVKKMSLLMGINLAKSLALYPLDTLRIRAMNNVPRGSGPLFGGAHVLIPIHIASDVLVNRVYVQLRNKLKACSLKGSGLMTSVAATCIDKVVSTPFGNIKRIIGVKNLSLLAAAKYTFSNGPYVGVLPSLSASLLGMAVYDGLYEFGKEKLQIKPSDTLKNGLLGLGTALLALTGSYPMVWLQNEVAGGATGGFVEIFKNLVQKDPLVVPTLYRGFGKTALLVAVDGVVVAINRSILDDNSGEASKKED